MPYERQTKLSYDNLDKFVHVTDSLLCNLFSSDIKYSRRNGGEKSIYDFISPQNSIENFISGEIFSSEGIIRISSRTELTTGTKIFVMLALAYFLHCRLNYKYERCNPDFYNCKSFDLYLYNILCYWAWDTCQNNWERRDKYLCGAEHFFENFLKLSFRFCDSFGIEHIWKGSQYSDDDDHSFQVKPGFDYGGYMRFLLSENGNPIHCNFGKSTRSFWQKYTNLARGNDPYRIEDGKTSSMDLIVYCLSLGLEEDTLNRLISLRNEAYPNRAIINPDTPNFGEQEHEVTKLL